MDKVAREINAQKRAKRSIFRRVKLGKAYWLSFGTTLVGSAVIGNLFNTFLGGEIIATLLLAAVLAFLTTHTFSESPPKAFGQRDNFLGLFVSPHKNDSSNRSKAFIKRDSEVDYIFSAVKDALKKDSGSRMLCLVGASGSGKSIILEMLKKKLADKGYEAVDFTDLYFSDIANERDTRINSTNEKTVVVFDQFEQVLLSEDISQMPVLNIVDKIIKNKSFIIFSLRREYLQHFFEWLDKNKIDISISKGKKNDCLKLSVGDCRKDKPKGMPNIIIVGSRVQANNKSVNSEILRRCEESYNNGFPNIFNDHTDVYNPIAEQPLIVQQIMLNMLTQHEKMTKRAVASYKDNNLDDVINCYYNVQLCSTEDYYHASQIMYILSMARLDNIQLDLSDVLKTMCITTEDELGEVKTCIEKLINLNLIRNVTRPDDISDLTEMTKLEIAHDYIAQSFGTYANTEMSPKIKAALDDSRAVNLHNRKNSRSAKPLIKENDRKDTWIFVVWIISLFDVLFKYTAGITGYANEVSVAVAIFAVFSLFYVFLFYRNITQFYDISSKSTRKLDIFRKVSLAALYIIAMISGTAAVWMGEHWLVCLGLGNSINGISALVIATGNISAQNGKGTYISYGLKTSFIGLILIGLSVFLGLFPGTSILGVDVRTLIEQIGMASLLIYGFIAHLNKEFFYVFSEPLLNMQSSDSIIE